MTTYMQRHHKWVRTVTTWMIVSILSLVFCLGMLLSALGQAAGGAYADAWGYLAGGAFFGVVGVFGVFGTIKRLGSTPT